MSASPRAKYIDSSALVKLAVVEQGSTALRQYLTGRDVLVASALARTEVARSLLPYGPDAVARGEQALSRVELVRVSDRLLRLAGTLAPPALRSLDAIHLATALSLGDAVREIVTYDARMAGAARAMGWRVTSPH